MVLYLSVNDKTFSFLEILLRERLRENCHRLLLFDSHNAERTAFQYLYLEGNRTAMCTKLSRRCSDTMSCRSPNNAILTIELRNLISSKQRFPLFTFCESARYLKLFIIDITSARHKMSRHKQTATKKNQKIKSRLCSLISFETYQSNRINQKQSTKI